MGEPLSPARVFDFPKDQLEPHPAYDFFVHGPLPGYAGNPNNNNEWIVEAEEQMIAPVDNVDEDIAMLFGDDDFEDDDSEGFDEEEDVWEVNEEWLMAPVTLPLMPTVPLPSVYEVGGPSTAAAEGQSFPHPAPRLLVPPSVPDGSCRAGFVGSSAAEGFADSSTTDYGFEDEQPGEHIDAVHYWNGQTSH
nr:hypothetical protein [Tanacetum cinerariifolium]